MFYYISQTISLITWKLTPQAAHTQLSEQKPTRVGNQVLTLKLSYPMTIPRDFHAENSGSRRQLS